MSEPQFSHDREELLWVADLLEVLNRTDRDDTGFEGSITFWWCDRKMGTIARIFPDELDSDWAYFPEAKAGKDEA